ncbi:hypothetical protein WN73_38550 [Bradyrhizobium sp. CCBAU 45394]|uniref:hypothetical protein n=1 Tax=Bradyrhizobium sp. CCBAU 45394 TaxID=1325087 RepID=UPI002302622B|nr:hypothetical protein [Bradyrhizobium sp. CCBAU 45394]MDA9396415.1 hypothetical protein [Bradyrhizobium sp. CCBAU 45394]
MPQSQTVRFRVDGHHVLVWQRAAKKRGETLSAFVRAATHAAVAELVTTSDWKTKLFEIRMYFNAARHVRTDEQKNQRIEEGLRLLNKAIEAIDVR